MQFDPETKNVFLEIFDHAELARIVLKKLAENKISLRNAVIFPVSLESTWLLNALLMADQENIIRDITWTADKEKAPISPSTIHVIFLEPIVRASGSNMKHGKKWLAILSKRYGIEKQVRRLKPCVIAWFSNSKSKQVEAGALLVAAIHTEGLDAIKLFDYAGTATASSQQLSMDDAKEQLGWDPEYVFKDKDELILDKLRSDLWI